MEGTDGCGTAGHSFSTVATVNMVVGQYRVPECLARRTGHLPLQTTGLHFQDAVPLNLHFNRLGRDVRLGPGFQIIPESFSFLGHFHRPQFGD